MVKGELDYRNASKLITLTKKLNGLTVILCILTIILALISIYPQINKCIQFFKSSGRNALSIVKEEIRTIQKLRVK